MTTWTICSDNSLQQFFGDIRGLYRANHYLKITARIGKDRSLDQNAIGHVWYDQLSRELPEDDSMGWKCYCKLHHGVPILRAEDEEFRTFYDGSIKSLSYEQKLQAMRFVPVTSIMTKGQKSKYLEAVQEDFRRKGVKLEFPEES